MRATTARPAAVIRGIVAPGVSSPHDPMPALWPFAVHAHALPGVAALCLRLQDEHGLDVDVLLSILWQACRGATVDDAAIDRMLAAAAPVQRRVGELRALRRAVGSDRAHDPRWQETYEHLKAAELAAERVELAALEASLAPERRASSEPIDPALLDTAKTDDDLAPVPVPVPVPPPAPDSAALALAALRRLAERCGASSCEPLLRALVEAALPRPSAARD